MNRADIAGVILAAGASSRMGQPKALLEYEGESFVARMVRILGSVCGQVIVVLGYDAERVRAAAPAGATIVVNPEPERGLLSSLQCGLREAGGAHAVMFLPVDYGALRIDTVTRVAAEAGVAQVVAPIYEGRHGHPVCIARAVVDELLAVPATAQARDVIRRHREATRFIEVDDTGAVNDIDTPEDYRALVERAR